MADPLEVGDQGGQSRPDQAALLDAGGQRGLVGPSDSGRTSTRDWCAPRRSTAAGSRSTCWTTLADVAVAPQLAAAAGAAVEGVHQEGRRPARGEQGAFVLGMAGLAAGPALVLSRRRSGRGRLDDVGGGRLGGGGGVLAGGGELLLELGDGGLQRLESADAGHRLALAAARSSHRESLMVAPCFPFYYSPPPGGTYPVNDYAWGISTRQTTRPPSSSRSKAASPSAYAATRSPRRVGVGDKRTRRGSRPIGNVPRPLPARSVRRRLLLGRRPDPDTVLLGDQEAGLRGQRDHLGAVVEPAVEVPPFPPPQALGGRLELAGGVGDVVVLHAARRRRRGGHGRPGTGPRVSLSSAFRAWALASSHFQLTPARPPNNETASRHSSRAITGRPARAGQPCGRPHRPCHHLLALAEARLQVFGQHEGGAVTAGRLLLQAVQRDRLQVAAGPAAGAAGPARCFRHGAQHLQGAIRGVRQSSREQLIERSPPGSRRPPPARPGHASPLACSGAM